MRSALLLSALLAVLPPVLEAADGPLDAMPLDAMVKTERDFARLSREAGIEIAFPHFAAEGAVVFSPSPANLAAWLEGHPAPDSLLDWHPALAGIADSGDLGWTSGPWSLETGTDRGTVYGTYLTVWRLQQDGTWKWEIDTGVWHPEPAGEPGELVVFRTPRIDPEGVAGSVEAKNQLFTVDRALGDATEKQGRVDAYRSYGDPELRLFRQGQPTVAGLEGSLEVLGKSRDVENWRSEDGGISLSADLGYTYGYVHTVEDEGRSRPTTGYYMRIWRKTETAGWKVLFDVELPPPPAGP